jgi:hypothetical protein
MFFFFRSPLFCFCAFFFFFNYLSTLYILWGMFLLMGCLDL